MRFRHESVRQEYFFPWNSGASAKGVECGGFFLGQLIFFLTQRGRNWTNRDERLHLASPLSEALIVGRDSHRSADERSMTVDSAASIRLQRGAGDLAELLHESVHFSISPIVKQNGLPKLRSCRFHGGDLHLGSLLDQAMVLQIHEPQAVLKDLRVEDRNGEGADAAAHTAKPAGELA